MQRRCAEAERIQVRNKLEDAPPRTRTEEVMAPEFCIGALGGGGERHAAMLRRSRKAYEEAALFRERSGLGTTWGPGGEKEAKKRPRPRPRPGDVVAPDCCATGPAADCERRAATLCRSRKVEEKVAF